MAWQAYAAMAGFQVVSAYQQAEMMERMGELKRRIAEQNAGFVEAEAWEVERMGFTQEARYQKAIDYTIGAQKVAFATADIDSSVGTAAAIKAETEILGKYNQMQIQREARAKALGLKQQALNIRLGASFDETATRAAAGATRVAGLVGAAQTGLSAYSRYGGGGSTSAKVTTESSTGWGSGGNYGGRLARSPFDE